MYKHPLLKLHLVLQKLQEHTNTKSSSYKEDKQSYRRTPPVSNKGGTAQYRKIKTILSTYYKQMLILPYEKAHQLITAS